MCLICKGASGVNSPAVPFPMAKLPSNFTSVPSKVKSDSPLKESASTAVIILLLAPLSINPLICAPVKFVIFEPSP